MPIPTDFGGKTLTARQKNDDFSVGLNFELDDNGLCPKCAAIFCPIWNQEHNADDAGYCQHCKEPVIDVATGKFFE